MYSRQNHPLKQTILPKDRQIPEVGLDGMEHGSCKDQKKMKYENQISRKLTKMKKHRISDSIIEEVALKSAWNSNIFKCVQSQNTTHSAALPFALSKKWVSTICFVRSSNPRFSNLIIFSSFSSVF